MIYKLKRNIPNIITISRIVSLILGFVFFIKNKIILSLIFYIYGAVSDAFDGYFARKLSAYSKFGQYLDAISDKLYFLSLIIILLIYKYYLLYFSFETSKLGHCFTHSSGSISPFPFKSGLKSR